MTTWEHYAIAPAQSSLALVDGRLPSVETSWRLTDVLDAFEPLIGRPPYLRMAAHAEVDGDRAVRLHVFDLGEAAARDAEVPGPLRPAFDRWLAEQRGAEPPALRAAWARPGWLAAAEAWAGCALRPHRMWPLSAVLRGSLAGETVFFKAVFPLFHHEPAVTQALGLAHAGSVPEVVRADHDLAARAAVLDFRHAQPDEPVVDQYVVSGLQHVADHGRRDRQLAVGAELLRAYRHVLALLQDDGVRELADPQLGPLQIGDERDRPPCLFRGRPHAARALGVLGVRPVREVEARGVDARRDEGLELLRRVRRRAERRDDLRAAFSDHDVQRSSGARVGRGVEAMMQP